MAGLHLAPGVEFAGRYSVVGCAGRGSTSVVYRASPLDGGPDVALKVPAPRVLEDPHWRVRFEREAATTARIASECVVGVVDSGIDERSGTPWFAMEYVEGPTLAEYLELHAPLPHERALPILRDVFGGVAAAHRAGVVHRDLTPSNISIVPLAEGRERAKVADFGISKTVDATNALQTMPGLGAPLWVAPEQLQPGYAPAPPADVWALGLIVFQALTGRLYWRFGNEEGSFAELSRELLFGELEPATERLRAFALPEGLLPVGFDVWFRRAVVRDPAQRFADAEVAFAALSSLLDARGGRRHPFWLPVAVAEFEDGVAVSHDVSDMGLLLVSATRPSVGDELTLSFKVPPDRGQERCVAGRVVRVSANDSDPQGLWPHKFAVAFSERQAELGAQLARLDTPARPSGD